MYKSILPASHFYTIFRSLGVFGVTAPLDSTSWNVTSNAVGCGAGKCLTNMFLECPVLILILVSDATQFDCMKKVHYRTLEDAVISTQGYFFIVIDSKPAAVCISIYL